MFDPIEFLKNLISRKREGKEFGHKTEGVVCRKNVAYGDGKRFYDLFAPNARRASSLALSIPVIYLHGELFSDAQRRSRDEFCARLASEGFSVVNAGFGVCEDGSASAAEALDTLTDHLVTEISGFAADGRVIFCADGSGVWLAVDFIARAARDPRSFRVRPAALVAFSGLYDLSYFADNHTRRGFKSQAVRAFCGLDAKAGFTREERGILAGYDVTPRVDEAFPPVFAAYSVNDEYYPGQGERFAKACARKGVTLREYRAEHAFCRHNWQLAENDVYASAVTASAVRFMRDVASGAPLRGEYTEI